MHNGLSSTILEATDRFELSKKSFAEIPFRPDSGTSSLYQPLLYILNYCFFSCPTMTNPNTNKNTFYFFSISNIIFVSIKMPIMPMKHFNLLSIFNLVERKRIELSTSSCKGEILPLNYRPTLFTVIPNIIKYQFRITITKSK